MRPKIITDALIEATMEKNGWIEGSSEAHAKKKVLSHYDACITSDWDDSDVYIYPEITSDGYSVYVVTYNPKKISISEDVYYYEDGIEEALTAAIEQGESIMCEEDHWIDRAIDQCYSNLLSEMWTRTEEELLEWGYVKGITNPINTLAFIEMVSQDKSLNINSGFYKGQVTIKAESDPKWLKYLEQIWQDHERYSIVANHYGLVINAVSREEIVFSEVTPK